METESLNFQTEDVSMMRDFDNFKKYSSHAILFFLLYLDGLIMINIDNVNKINFIAESHKSDLVLVLKNILRFSTIDNNSKEIASHILSAILGFCEIISIDDESIHSILTWTKEYHILS